MIPVNYEEIASGITVCSSEWHRFGTDAVLLTEFSGYKSKETVCDLGTGCGIIPLLMQRTAPPKKIYGVDIQKEAIEQFRLGIQNSTALQSELVPILADLKTLSDFIPNGTLDLVTCNPPYKAYSAGIESQLDAQKIARHEILCTIYDICDVAKKALRFGGRLCICNRPERLADCMDAMRQNKIEPKRLQFVSKSSDAAPWLFLLEGRMGGKPFLNVLPNCIVSEGNPVSTFTLDGGDK